MARILGGTLPLAAMSLLATGGIDRVAVIGPTKDAAPVAIEQATAIPTPVPAPAFLPAVRRDGPLSMHADVVLLIDTSASMAGPRLAAARMAAGALVQWMSDEGDQVAVIAFDSEPRVFLRLTEDRAALEHGLNNLRAGHDGTRFDRATAAARTELLDIEGTGTRNHDNKGVIVMLADGPHDGPANDAIGEAFHTGTSGIAIFTVSLGAEADRDLMRAMADLGSHYHATHEGELKAIYDTIGVRLLGPMHTLP